MKIEVEVPDWAGRSNIWIFSETEPVAYKMKDGEWHVKKTRCSGCGECCMAEETKMPFGLIDGKCTFLKKEPGDNNRWKCTLGLFRPFQCCIADRMSKNCVLEYE